MKNHPAEEAVRKKNGFQQWELKPTWRCVWNRLYERPGNLDEFFTTVKETHIAKEMQLSDMFNKTMGVVLAHSE